MEGKHNPKKSSMRDVEGLLNQFLKPSVIGEVNTFLFTCN